MFEMGENLVDNAYKSNKRNPKLKPKDITRL